MTTISVVRKGGVAAIAADTLTKWGSGKESAKYIANSEKIIQVGDNYIAEPIACGIEGQILPDAGRG